MILGLDFNDSENRFNFFPYYNEIDSKYKMMNMDKKIYKSYIKIKNLWFLRGFFYSPCLGCLDFEGLFRLGFAFAGSSAGRARASMEDFPRRSRAIAVIGEILRESHAVFPLG